ELPADNLDRIPVGPEFLGVVFDRPTGPGNIGSIIRSADAFGADGLIVTGHAADVYDPKAVRATTGSLFAVPAVRVPSHREVLDWVRRSAIPIVVVGTDEHGSVDVFDFDFTQPALVLIPITGSASSLNAANAATAVLYEVSRQRSHSSTTR